MWLCEITLIRHFDLGVFAGLDLDQLRDLIDVNSRQLFALKN